MLRFWNVPRGQLYADDLACLTAGPRGMQRLLDETRSHSARIDSEIHLGKTCIVEFGIEPSRLRHPPFMWGGTAIRCVRSAPYLGLHLHDSCSWDLQLQTAARKGRMALHKWSRVLRSPFIPAAAKRLVLHTRVAPSMWYGMELWSVRTDATQLDRVLLDGARLVAGVRRSAMVSAYARWRTLQAPVLLSDLGVLSARGMCQLAHARHRVRAHRADVAVRTAGLPEADEEAAHAAVGRALDFMGFAVRMSGSPWVAEADAALWEVLRAAPGEADAVLPATRPAPHSPLALPDSIQVTNTALRAGASALALAARGVGVDRVPACGTRSSSRVRKRPRHLPARAQSPSRNPLSCGLFLDGDTSSSYLHAVSDVAHVFASLRSSHLIGDYSHAYGSSDLPHCCDLCMRPLFSPNDDFGSVARTEARWRHVEHLLLSCPLVTCPGLPDVPAFSVLRRDLLDVAASETPARACVAAAFPPVVGEDVAAARRSVPFLLDPVRSLRSCGGVSFGVVSACTALVAAYVAGVASRVCGGEAAALAAALWPRLRLPSEAGVRSLLPPPRSSAMDAVAASQALLDGVCACSESARGAVADARLGRA